MWTGVRKNVQKNWTSSLAAGCSCICDNTHEDQGIRMFLVSNRTAEIMMHGNIPNPYVRAAHRCPCGLLLLSWKNQRLCGYCFEHSPTWPEAPQWHDEISQACFCCRLCDRRDVNQGKRPVPAQPHVHYLRPTLYTRQQPAEERLLSHKRVTDFHPVPNSNSLRRFVMVLSCLVALEEQSFYVIPNGTRQAFLLIAEMLATERMSPHGFVPCAHAAFKCHCRNISRHCLCFPLLVTTLLISETNCAFVYKWDTHLINKSDVSISYIRCFPLVV